MAIISCIRLRIRRKVDLPQPDGPMRAVTSPGSIISETRSSTWWVPNQAEISRASRPASGSCSFAARASARRSAPPRNRLFLVLDEASGDSSPSSTSGRRRRRERPVGEVDGLGRIGLGDDVERLVLARGGGRRR